MSNWRLNTAKLAEDIERARGAGTDQEVSCREVARQAGIQPDVLTRLNKGYRMDVDNFLSLLMWLNPEARLADCVLKGDRRSAPAPAPRRRLYLRTPERSQGAHQ